MTAAVTIAMIMAAVAAMSDKTTATVMTAAAETGCSNNSTCYNLDTSLLVWVSPMAVEFLSCDDTLFVAAFLS